MKLIVGKGKTMLSLARNLLLFEWGNKRVIMGFLLGMVVPFYWLDNFLKYVTDYGEPVNILETFIVVVQMPGCNVLLPLGWLLVIADAPFGNGNTYFSLYRVGKRSWNGVSFLYMALQAFLYVFLMAVLMVFMTSSCGFIGKMWSSPVYALTKDIGNGEKYHLVFHRIGMMRSMDVLQAFFVTALCLGLYLFVLGQLLYTFNLLLGSFAGLAFTALFHVSGYLLARDGYKRFSLVSCGLAANYVDDYGMHPQPIITMLGFVVVCVILQFFLVKTADFRTDVNDV